MLSAIDPARKAAALGIMEVDEGHICIAEHFLYRRGRIWSFANRGVDHQVVERLAERLPQRVGV